VPDSATLPLLFSSRRHMDSRGWFSESYNERRAISLGIACRFVQDNQSFSAAMGTIRGLHFQKPPSAQAKLVQVVSGSIFDVAIDIRHGSPSYGKYVAATLSADCGDQLYIPTGFAHGFQTLQPNTLVAYKVSDFYSPEDEGGIRWDDASLNIRWPVFTSEVITSSRDSQWPPFASLRSPFTFDGLGLQELNRIMD
jgi:dTDP-4-dehydrorhamnose 3,5-epimerase